MELVSKTFFFSNCTYKFCGLTLPQRYVTVSFFSLCNKNTKHSFVFQIFSFVLLINVSGIELNENVSMSKVGYVHIYVRLSENDANESL